MSTLATADGMRAAQVDKALGGEWVLADAWTYLDPNSLSDAAEDEADELALLLVSG